MPGHGNSPAGLFHVLCNSTRQNDARRYRNLAPQATPGRLARPFLSHRSNSWQKQTSSTACPPYGPPGSTPVFAHVHDGVDQDGSAPKVDLTDHVDYGTNGDLAVTLDGPDTNNNNTLTHEITHSSGTGAVARFVAGVLTATTKVVTATIEASSTSLGNVTVQDGSGGKGNLDVGTLTAQEVDTNSIKSSTTLGGVPVLDVIYDSGRADINAATVHTDTVEATNAGVLNVKATASGNGSASVLAKNTPGSWQAWLFVHYDPGSAHYQVSKMSSNGIGLSTITDNVAAVPATNSGSRLVDITFDTSAADATSGMAQVSLIGTLSDFLNTRVTFTSTNTFEVAIMDSAAFIIGHISSRPCSPSR